MEAITGGGRGGVIWEVKTNRGESRPHDILFSVFPRRRRPKPELRADRGPLPLVSIRTLLYMHAYCQA